jgi:hypothetical protein
MVLSNMLAQVYGACRIGGGYMHYGCSRTQEVSILQMRPCFLLQMAHPLFTACHARLWQDSMQCQCQPRLFLPALCKMALCLAGRAKA